MAQRSGPGWIITYVDLCTLLLAFFVLLVSLSTLDQSRQTRALHSLEGSFGQRESSRMRRIEGSGAQPVFSLNALRELNRKHTLDAALISRQGDRLVIRIDRDTLFPSVHGFEISSAMRDYLETLATTLQLSGRAIEIRGHADPGEGGDDPNWPSRSWEVSLCRAQAIFTLFRDLGIDARRMSAHGFGFHQPLEISADQGRKGANARVEVIVGPNESLPTRIRLAEQAASNFHYKNFFFKLFPMENMAGKGD